MYGGGGLSTLSGACSWSPLPYRSATTATAVAGRLRTGEASGSSVATTGGDGDGRDDSDGPARERGKRKKRPGGSARRMLAAKGR